jgi:Xaa-Pro aminopeptidase
MGDPDMDYPHYYPLTTPIEMGDVVMTEVAAGYGGYYGKLWGTFFIGDPTPEYEKMFELGAAVGCNLQRSIKAGVRAGDLKSICQDIRCHGMSMTDEDHVLESNVCVGTTGWLVTADAKKGIWLGDLCVVTDSGVEKLQKYPIRDIHVVT